MVVATWKLLVSGRCCNVVAKVFGYITYMIKDPGSCKRSNVKLSHRRRRWHNSCCFLVLLILTTALLMVVAPKVLPLASKLRSNLFSTTLFPLFISGAVSECVDLDICHLGSWGRCVFFSEDHRQGSRRLLFTTTSIEFVLCR